MMEIKAHSKNYEVIFEENFDFMEKLAELDQTLFIIDNNIYSIYREKFVRFIPKDKVYILEAVEQNKTIITVQDICNRITDFEAKKNVTIIAVGGGITQDIVGFAANIIYRGIKWILVPTTLLAGCDSCIGGKTSLNFREYKNLLGTFYPPDKIYICPLFFETLTKKDFLSGLGEVIKFNIMSGYHDIAKISEELPKIFNRDISVLNKYIYKSLEFKKKYIEIDEYDQGIRNHLNFAHTFGHAFESVTEYAIPHGTAVAMGMVVACDISRQRNYITSIMQEEIDILLLKIIDIPLLKLENGLDINKCYDTKKIVEKIKKDKKQINEGITAVLFKDIELNLDIFHDIQIDEINNALLHLQGKLGR